MQKDLKSKPNRKNSRRKTLQNQSKVNLTQDLAQKALEITIAQINRYFKGVTGFPFQNNQ